MNHAKPPKNMYRVDGGKTYYQTGDQASSESLDGKTPWECQHDDCDELHEQNAHRLKKRKRALFDLDFFVRICRKFVGIASGSRKILKSNGLDGEVGSQGWLRYKLNLRALVHCVRFEWQFGDQGINLDTHTKFKDAHF